MLLFAVLQTFSVLQFSLQGLVGILGHGLSSDLGFTPTDLALAASLFFYPYILLQIPAGLLIDRFGLRPVAGVALLVAATGCVLFAVSRSTMGILLARLVMGLGAPFAFVSVLTAIPLIFPPGRFPLVMALAELSGMIGSAAVNVAIAGAAATFGRQRAILGVAAILAGLAVVVGLESRAAGRRRQAKAKAPLGLSARISLLRRHFVGDPAVLLAVAYSAAMFVILSVFVHLWAPLFFQQAHGMSPVASAAAAATVLVGIAGTSPLLGGALPRRRYPAAMLVGSLVAGIAFGALCASAPLGRTAVTFAALALGAGTACFQLSFAIVAEKMPADVRGAAMGITNMATVGLGTLLQPLVALSLSAGTTAEATALRHWNRGLAWVMGSLVLAMGFALALARWERRRSAIPVPVTLT